MSPSESNMSDDPSFILRKWHEPKALGNRYENQASPLKKASKDIWEFPRHRIKVILLQFYILLYLRNSFLNRFEKEIFL